VSATRPAVPDPTEIAERYVIEKKLGAGAFGTVYKARDKKLRRLVAIKTIRLEGLAASSVALEDLVKRFEQEAEVAARVQHPNIVALWDIGTWEGQRSHPISVRLSPLHIRCVLDPKLTLEEWWQSKKCLAVWREGL
jgi:serine/threonine protein kinase